MLWSGVLVWRWVGFVGDRIRQMDEGTMDCPKSVQPKRLCVCVSVGKRVRSHIPFVVFETADVDLTGLRARHPVPAHSEETIRTKETPWTLMCDRRESRPGFRLHSKLKGRCCSADEGDDSNWCR
ncbi:hypothetical protein MLD38_000455 [Melastoma candidum]|uniref:Uncharacterized protein n=1 Tax=Melastoma candidum TaxID=119954 RepID=A0ACB9SC32_9MYRT|nr:hypothetical protein MLD38_000455 [Melastoma candidum]